MIIRILVWLLVLIVTLFIGYWIFTGGLSRGLNFAKNIDNPLDFFISSTTGSLITLPWQQETAPGMIDITDQIYGNGYTADSQTTGSTYDQLNELQSQYDELYEKVKDPKNFGNPSPYRGQVFFGSGATQESSPASEFVLLHADPRNSAPITLTGWSIQSAVTGLRVPLPAAAPLFVSGVLNTNIPATLDPGNTALISTGPSPVGISFRENKCSGYLAELQQFSPPIERRCPSAEDELPLTAQNIQVYGDVCVDYVKSVPTCHFPGTDPAIEMPQKCKDFLLTRLSYNGCVNSHRLEGDFYAPTWRLYLSSNTQLWRDTHDVVRLLDEHGRTVDVLTY